MHKYINFGNIQKLLTIIEVLVMYNLLKVLPLGCVSIVRVFNINYN